MGDTVLVEVDGLFDIVLRWGGEPTNCWGEEQRELGSRCIGVVADHGKHHCIYLQ